LISLAGIRARVRTRFPRLAASYRELKEAVRMIRYGRRHLADTFSTIYHQRLWGETETVSGPGSILATTKSVRTELPALLESIGARSLLDAPCGDFRWMSGTPIELDRYIGVDIVPDLIEANQRRYANSTRDFRVSDITRDPLPRVDVILSRDYFIHCSYAYIKASIANFRRSGSTYLLTTTYEQLRKNENVLTGSWRPLNLQLAPFKFPSPQKLIVEEGDLGRSLGLWRLADL
jgi:hypothetical protein